MLILTIIDAVDSRDESTESPELASGAGLGVVELTVALHHVYDTPRDEICFMCGRRGSIKVGKT